MISARVLESLVAPNDDDAVLDKFVDGWSLNRVEKVRLMVLFSGDRILSFLEDDDMDNLMEVHDCLAECVLNQRLFGEKPTRPLTASSDISENKRESALFRIRKSNIVAKQTPLLKTETLVGKNQNMSSSQLTRPGTGESSTSTIRLKPVTKVAQLDKTAASLQIQPTNNPFSIPFTAQQDLLKKTGAERVLILTSVMRRFVTSIYQNMSLPVKTAIIKKSLANLQEDIVNNKTNVLQGEKITEIQNLINESGKLKVAETKTLKTLLENLRKLSNDDLLSASSILEQEVNKLLTCTDFQTLKTCFKSILDKTKDRSLLNIVEITSVLIAYSKFIDIAKVTKYFTLASIAQDPEKKKKICAWFSKCIAVWGKMVSDFKDNECIPDKLFFESSALVTEQIVSMKHFFSYLKFASTFEKLPISALPAMEYYLLENRDAWKSVAKTTD